MTVVIGLGILTWTITFRQVQKGIEYKLINSAEAIDREIPGFLAQGWQVIEQNISPNIISLPYEQQINELAQLSQVNGYFQREYLIDGQGRFLAAYPSGELSEGDLTAEDLARIHSIITGADSDLYLDDAPSSLAGSYLTFLEAIKDQQGTLVAIVVCRSTLVGNPLASALVTEMDSIRFEQGKAFLIDNYGEAIYLTKNTQVEQLGDLESIKTSQINAVTLVGGESGIAYSKAINVQPWVLILFVPTQFIVTNTVQIVTPIVLIVSITLFVILIAVYWQLRKAFTKIDGYSQRILGNVRAQSGEHRPGKQDSELGRLQYALASIKNNLDSQIEEQRSLKEIASFFIEMDGKQNVLRTVAELMIKKGAASVHFIFLDREVSESIFLQPTPAQWGPDAHEYEYLEGQIADLIQKQDPLLIPNISRSKLIREAAGMELPGALEAFGIKRGDEKFGYFWVSYLQPKTFVKEEVSFLAAISEEISNGIMKTRKLAHIQKERSLLQHGLDSITEPLIFYRPATSIMFANKAMLEMGKIVREDWMRLPLDEAILHSQLRELLSELEPTPGTAIMEMDGRTYRVSRYPVSENELVQGWICLFSDVSEFLEKEKHQLEFVNLVNHDLRSPLTLIRGYISMLEMVGSLSEHQKSYVIKINDNIDSMTYLVNSVLNLERLQGGAEIQLEVVDPVNILDRVYKAIEPLATQKNIKVVIEKGEHGVIQADKTLLEQALFNLAENAIRFSSVGGKVEIKLKSDVSTVKFIIEDHGVGISPIDLPKLFNGRKPGASQDSKVEMNGLGLVIVKVIVDRHHGIIRADSQLGKGSVFTMELPRGNER